VRRWPQLFTKQLATNYGNLRSPSVCSRCYSLEKINHARKSGDRREWRSSKPGRITQVESSHSDGAPGRRAGGGCGSSRLEHLKRVLEKLTAHANECGAHRAPVFHRRRRIRLTEAQRFSATTRASYSATWWSWPKGRQARGASVVLAGSLDALGQTASSVKASRHGVRRQRAYGFAMNWRAASAWPGREPAGAPSRGFA